MSVSSRSAHVRRPVVRPLVLALATVLPAAAMAQQDAASPQAATLDAISVTAARKSENIQDVPVSISTVSGEKLDALVSGGTDIRFLSGRVPSLNIESSFGRAFPRFYIRG
ncbi:MAG: TonB-dependent receptor, partial [Stenotrophomonas sp.]